MVNTSINTTCVVVLNWNGIEDTIACVESLLKQSISNFHILIVDNGSTDSSHDMLIKLRSVHPDRISLIFNDTNKGFAGGVNTGIRWGIKHHYDYVALLNNDAIADSHWLTHLQEQLMEPNIGIVTGLLLRQDGLTIDSTSEQYSLWGLPFPRDRNQHSEKASNAGNVFGATGGGTIYKVALFQDIGLFDEAFFAYYEDVDISFRAQLAGWNVYYTPKAIAYHKQGATSSKLGGFTIVQTFKNLPLLFIKNVPRALLIPIGIRFYLSYLLIFINAIAKGSGLSACKGVIQSLLLTPYALRLRFNIQRNKRISADAIKTLLWNDLPPDQIGIRKFRRIFTGKS